jgi:uncharacterized protein involved in response to NO
MSRSRAGYDGPAILSYGFRPFFFFGSLYAAVSIAVWLPVFSGFITFNTAFIPRDWHIHEMLFGYVAAVIAGFLMTAVPNWTGRLPLRGGPLALLFLTWIAGWLAVSASAWIGWLAAAAVDSLFLLLLVGAVAREIVAGRKWDSLKIVGAVGLFGLANVAFHLEAHFAGAADYSVRLGLAVVILLVSLVGGRIIPSFTRNWLARSNPGRLPVPFAKFDVLTLAVSTVALASWVALPASRVVGALTILCGVLHLIRLGRWAGDRVMADRLVLILHVAYLFVPLGFLLTGLSAFDIIGPGAGIHAWAAGAIGAMTLAVMTRATLGHTGRPLKASVATQVIYAAVVSAAVLRVCATLPVDHADQALLAAGFAWVLAFAVFALAYFRPLWTPRLA